MESIRSKIGLQFLVSNGSVVAHFLASLILARLLTPAEIGVFSITAVLVGFTQVFRDFGVVSYIKRQKELTPQILQAATGVLFVTSWSIAAGLYLSTDLWAQFFRQEAIKEIMPVLALGFVFIPFGSIPQAVLARSLEVKKTTAVTMLSTTVYVTTCLVLAVTNHGYMSMAWANLAGIVVSGVALMLLMPKGMTLRPSFSNWSKVAQFGAGSMLASSLKSLDTALPDLILGKLSGAHQVGIFSRANSTVNIINTLTAPTINYFALPHLATVHHGGEKVNDEVMRNVALITGLIWPVLAATGVTSEEIIDVLYGATWAESAAAVPYLCVVFAIQATFGLMQQALTAVGRPYVSAIPLAVALALKVALALALYDGTLSSFGLSICIGELLTIPVYLAIAKAYTDIKLKQWGIALHKSLLVSLIVFGCTFVIYSLTERYSNNFWQVLSVFLIGLISWLIAIFLTKHPLQVEIRRMINSFSGNGEALSYRKITANSKVDILIYGAVASVLPSGSRTQQIFIAFKQSLNLYLDLFMWKFGCTRRLDYRHYVTPQVVNRGDEAISVASRMLFHKKWNNSTFLNCNWGDRSAFSNNTTSPKLIAICGGGYLFFGKDGTLASRVKMDLLAMNESKIPVIIFGVGLNMLLDGGIGSSLKVSHEDEETLRALCGRASLISVRDRRTQELLANYTTKNVYLVGDPALVMGDCRELPVLNDRISDSEVMRIGINFPFHGMDANTRIRRDLPKYIQMLKDLQRVTNCDFVYFVHFSAERIIYEIIQSEGIQLEICAGEPAVLLHGYQSLNIHLGGMLHSCIMAASVGTPSVALAYDVKHAGFFESLGIEEYCIPAVPFDSARFLTTTLRAIQNEKTLRKTIVSRRLGWEIAVDSFVEQCHYVGQNAHL